MSQDDTDTDSDFIVDDIDISDPTATPGWDGAPGPSLPAGDYFVEVIKAKMASTKNDGRQLELDLQVKMEGDHFDATFKHWITMPSSSHKDGGAGAKKRIAHVVRDALRVELHPQTGGFAGKDLLGKQMWVSIKHDVSTYFNIDQNADVTKTKMIVFGERPADSVAAPATETKPAAAPAAKPAAKPAAAPAARRPAAAPPAARRG